MRHNVPQAIDYYTRKIKNLEAWINDIDEWLVENSESIDQCKESIARLQEVIDLRTEKAAEYAKDKDASMADLEKAREELRFWTDNFPKESNEILQEVEEQEDPQLAWYRKNNPGLKIGRL